MISQRVVLVSAITLTLLQTESVYMTLTLIEVYRKSPARGPVFGARQV
jgi:hypothetical protein